MIEDFTILLKNKKNLLYSSDSKELFDELKLEYDILEIINSKSITERLLTKQFAKKYKTSYKLLMQSKKEKFDPTIDDLKEFAQEMKVKLTMQIVDAGKLYKTL